MIARLAHLFRHPIKSIGYEELGTASLSEGRGLPLDRVWAISTQEARFDSPLTEWAAKRNFVRGVAAPQLMAVQARLSEDGTMVLSHPQRPTLHIHPDLPQDQLRLIDWISPLWPANRPAPRAVERPGVALADMAEPYVSILSLGSLAALSAQAGQQMSPHRFRGNLWVDGWPDWHERNLIGQRLRIGTAELTIAMPITRCRATCANPLSGVADIDTLALLKSLNGDMHFGLYAEVTRAGQIARDDIVEIL